MSGKTWERNTLGEVVPAQLIIGAPVGRTQVETLQSSVLSHKLGDEFAGLRQAQAQRDRPAPARGELVEQQSWGDNRRALCNELTI